MQDLPKEFISTLASILPADSFTLDPAECGAYGFDNSPHLAQPQAVAFPHTHQQVEQLVLLCNTHRVAITPRGRGTGTTGATVPIHAGLVLSFENMNTILRMDPENRMIIVQPGVTNEQVQLRAAEHGFFWPPDPTSAAYCSVGGNLAYNSAGPRAVKYGTPRENTLGLTAITGTGKTIHTGVKTTKGVVGYDLTRLIIGSEGTLAIITEATLKLTPVPECKTTLQATYQNIEHAAQAVSNIMAHEVTPCALEFIDGNAINMIREYSNADLPDNAGALLMIEVDGSSHSIQHDTDSVIQAASNSGLLSIKTAATRSETAELWKTRKALSPALRTIAPKKINEDVVVPVSNIPALLTGLEKLARKYDIDIVNFGHAGNGNIHVNLLIDPENSNQLEQANACLDEVFNLVLSLEGSLSGEHGIGLEKQAFIGKEIDATSLDLMRAIKKQFDPNNILNPGKMFPVK
ncbi:MAG TPA: FAD-binding protein [Gammaproteobacteria bacterium]|nr:FAD-binding protein [Gammaproteobacteria bacterium]